MPSVRSIALGIWVGAGSRYETPEESGVSHFIEHLLFKGSERFSVTDIADIFDSLGGEINALTNKEYTVLYARFIDEHLEQAFEVMADMALNPAFRDIDLEREVVLEEIAMYEDSPGEQVTDHLVHGVFGEHPLGKSVIGTREIINAATEQGLRAYHAGHYTLPNMVVAAAGNIDHERLRELAVERLARGNNRAAAQTPVGEVPAGNGGACIYLKDTQQYHICFGGTGISRHSEERYALSILDGILGSTASSRLFQEVREKRGLAYSVYSFDRMYSDTGLVGIYFGCRSDSVAEVTRIIREQLESLSGQQVDAAELRRAKECAKGRVLLGLETSQSRMFRLGRLTLTDTEIFQFDEIIRRIEAVSAEQVMELARRLYQPERLFAVAIGPRAEVFDEAVGLLGGGRELMVKTAC